MKIFIGDDVALLELYEAAITRPRGGANNPEGIGGRGGKVGKMVIDSIGINDHPEPPKPRQSPVGNMLGYAVRKLAKDRPDLLERVQPRRHCLPRGWDEVAPRCKDWPPGGEVIQPASGATFVTRDLPEAPRAVQKRIAEPAADTLADYLPGDLRLLGVTVGDGCFYVAATTSYAIVAADPQPGDAWEGETLVSVLELAEEDEPAALLCS